MKEMKEMKEKKEKKEMREEGRWAGFCGNYRRALALPVGCLQS